MTEQEARTLIADLTTAEKQLLSEFLLSLRASPTEEVRRDADARIDETIDDVDTPTGAIERIGCLLESIRHSMNSLDRAYFSQAVPEEHRQEVLWLFLVPGHFVSERGFVVFSLACTNGAHY